ncbi:MAG: DUF2062 domain-containing protein [Alphaproteobacteria bacterium]|nr:DUF2062 domain-containing protein [Alphaproteobacteria bacterium]
MDSLVAYINNFSKKLLIRLKRLQATPYSVAAGFACGVAISFTPFIGFHMILAALTAWLVRGNIIASAIGTIIGNPWTFPFIWIAVFYTGHFFLGNEINTVNVDFLSIFKSAGDAIYNMDCYKFGHDVWPVIYPMIVGCIPFYVAFWLISYKIMKKTMDKIENRRKKRLEEAKN